MVKPLQAMGKATTIAADPESFREARTAGGEQHSLRETSTACGRLLQSLGATYSLWEALTGAIDPQHPSQNKTPDRYSPRPR